MVTLTYLWQDFEDGLLDTHSGEGTRGRNRFEPLSDSLEDTIILYALPESGTAVSTKFALSLRSSSLP